MPTVARFLPALLVGVASLALLPGSALADGSGSGLAWPTASPIRVFNAAPAEQRALGLAIAAWNGAGAKVRFVQVTRRARAQVIVRYDPAVVTGCGGGWGSIGYPAFGGVAQVLLRRGTSRDGQGCAWPVTRSCSRTSSATCWASGTWPGAAP